VVPNLFIHRANIRGKKCWRAIFEEALPDCYLKKTFWVKNIWFIVGSLMQKSRWAFEKVLADIWKSLGGHLKKYWRAFEKVLADIWKSLGGQKNAHGHLAGQRCFKWSPQNSWNLNFCSYCPVPMDPNGTLALKFIFLTI
jgi:hypothetical protein